MIGRYLILLDDVLLLLKTERLTGFLFIKKSF